MRRRREQGEERASAAVNKGVSTAAEGIVGAAFTEHCPRLGITLDGRPDCSSKLDTDVKGLTVKGTVNCSADHRQRQGGRPLQRRDRRRGNATSCKGHFLVKVEGKAKVDKDVDVCELAKAT